ncbi:MAG: NAD(P)H-hydrate dehydratase [Candidatus Nanopelagicales bacterium]
MITLHDTAAIQQAEQAHAAELAAGVLMDRAAHGVAAAVIDLLTRTRGGVVGARIVVLAGSGNNGADALFAGARLSRRGAHLLAISVGPAMHDAARDAFAAAGGRLIAWGDPAAPAVLHEADLVIDGLLGIGATGELREPIASIVRATHGLAALIVAVDVPTGVNADTGQVLADAVDADQTVTFGGLKPGLITMPGKAFAGGVRIVDIGIGDALESCGAVIDADDVAFWVPEPGINDHKYRRGVVGICAGSAQYPGAAFLSTAAALAADMGMVEFLDRGDDLVLPVVTSYPPVVATAADPASNARVNAWVVGPGFSGTPADRDAVGAILRCWTPVVLDAGALTVLSRDEQLRESVRLRSLPTVVTPHEGEFARLSPVPISDGRIAAAQALASDLNVVVVLKGSGTVIASPDGALFIDLLGSPVLSTAGSGDVLAGLIGALLAGAAARSVEQVDDAMAAEIAAAGCWLHGEAGRLAGMGGRSVTASELTACIGAAIASVRRPGRMGT